MKDLAVIIVISYLLGSFPTGILFGKLFRGIDIRHHGSGNTGATNSFRVLGWKTGLAVALVDIFKGFAAGFWVVRISFFGGGMPESMLFIAATLAVVLGHIFPIFAGFRGGRGFGAAVGAVIAQAPLAAPFCLGVFFITLGFTGWVSICAVIAAFTLPVAYVVIALIRGVPLDGVILGFFILIFFLTFYGARKKFFLYFRGGADVFEKVRIFRRRPYKK
jgi:glycerol-3-phosphate acyltransferase PlsY